jgi:histidyl-tRNA synthetase
MQFQTLPGFREFYPDACLLRNHLFTTWKRCARAYAFSEYDAPVLEPLSLYVEKSGEEIVGQLFHFTDRGEREVALRPEMTPSLARLVGAKANALKRPIRWFNIGEQYRYERPQKGRLRAFYQFNADILGVAEPTADAELIALLVASLKGLGLGPDSVQVRLSDRLLWGVLLKAANLSVEATSAVLAVVDKLGRMPREKSLAALEPWMKDAEGWLSGIEAMMREVRDFGALEAYFNGLAQPLAAADREFVAARLDEWRVLLTELDALGCSPYVQIDLSIVRGLAYYTGFVFEAFEATGEGRALAGGGRYDDLVQKLGGPAMPAVGFAMGDVTVADLLQAKDLLPRYFEKADVGLVVEPTAPRANALLFAQTLRAAGYSVEVPLSGQSLNKQIKAMRQKGPRLIAIFKSATEDSAAEADGVVELLDTAANVSREIKTDLSLLVPQTLAFLQDGMFAGEN